MKSTSTALRDDDKRISDEIRHVKALHPKYLREQFLLQYIRTLEEQRLLIKQEALHIDINAEKTKTKKRLKRFRPFICCLFVILFLSIVCYSLINQYNTKRVPEEEEQEQERYLKRTLSGLLNSSFKNRMDKLDFILRSNLKVDDRTGMST